MRTWPAVIGCLALAGLALPAMAQGPLSAEQERALKPKDSFKECADCPDMVVVPAGTFAMGSPNNERSRDANEGPRQRSRGGEEALRRPFATYTRIGIST
jgi:formylglycine-generating enzyme required for sulfatase activity